jgi:F0F1-type ATP synthase membrane subunit a
MNPTQYFKLQFQHFGEGLKLPLHLDTILISLGLGLLAHWTVYRCINKELVNNPTGRISKFQVLIEWIHEFVTSRIILSKNSRMYGILCSFGLTACFWIFAMNLMDLLPSSSGLFLTGGQPLHLVATEDLNLTMSLGFVTLLLFFVTKIARKGLIQTLLNYLKHPLGYIAFPLNLVLNIAGTFTTPFSIGVRLFSSMLAGGIICLVIAVAPAYLTTPLSLLWTIVHFPLSMLQIMIFVNTSLSYIQGEH